MELLQLLEQIVDAGKGKEGIWIQIGEVDRDSSTWVSWLQLGPKGLVEGGYFTEVDDVVHERSEPVRTNPSSYLIRRYKLTEDILNAVLVAVRCYRTAA